MKKQRVLSLVRRRQLAKEQKKKRIAQIRSEIAFWRETAWQINGPRQPPQWVSDVIEMYQKQLGEALA